MADNVRNREWLDAEELESGAPGLPRPDLNPLVNPLLGENMGRWAQVYFTSPPDQREQAVEKLLQELNAESGSKKPAGPPAARIPDPAALPKARESRPEVEFPELAIDSFANPESFRNHEPDPSAHALQDLSVCPSCLHQNPAEQRFCGICGTALSREVPPLIPQAAPPVQVSRPAENPESDWRWLRERSLSTYEVQSATGSRSRVVIALLVLLVIGLGGYILWQNRAQLSHQQSPPESSAVAEPNPAPSMNLPMAATPSPVTGKQDPQTKPQISAKPPALPDLQGQGTNQTAGGAVATDGSSSDISDDGRDELNRARQYLAGDAVPKNSWMASQLLWKAIGKQNPEAVLLLSDLYARGDGVPRSCEQARILLVSAAKKGSPAAAQKLRSIETSCR